MQQVNLIARNKITGATTTTTTIHTFIVTYILALIVVAYPLVQKVIERMTSGYYDQHPWKWRWQQDDLQGFRIDFLAIG